MTPLKQLCEKKEEEKEHPCEHCIDESTPIHFHYGAVRQPCGCFVPLTASARNEGQSDKGNVSRDLNRKWRLERKFHSFSQAAYDLIAISDTNIVEKIASTTTHPTESDARSRENPSSTKPQTVKGKRHSCAQLLIPT